jgi:hypothetical protein
MRTSDLLRVGWLRRIASVGLAWVAVLASTGCDGLMSEISTPKPSEISAGGFDAVPSPPPQMPTIDDPTPTTSDPSTLPPEIQAQSAATSQMLFAGLAAQDRLAPSFDVSGSVIREGIDVWFKPDKFNMACVNCHGSPAGIELAFVGISDENISRRGTAHFDQPQIDRVIAMVKELARLYKLPKYEPKTFRPLQPGGQPTEGATWQERDYNFLRSLSLRYAPTLVNSKMETIEEAKRAYVEIASIDKASMPIPTISPAWSGDGFHGAASDTHHEWIASLPALPKDGTSMGKIRASLMTYLSKPSNENFFNYYNTYRDHTSVGTVSSVNAARGSETALTHNAYHIERAKTSAALYAAHAVLQRAISQPALIDRGAFATVQTSGPRADSKNLVFIDALSRMGDNTQQRLGGPAIYPAEAIARMSDAVKSDMHTHLKFKNMDWWGLAFTYQPAINSVAAAYWLDGWVASDESDNEVFPSFRTFSMASRGVATNRFVFSGLAAQGTPKSFSMLHNSTALSQTEDKSLYFSDEHMKLHQRMALNIYKMRMLLRISEWLNIYESGERVTDVTDGRTSNNQWLDIELMQSFARRHFPEEVEPIGAMGATLGHAAQQAYAGKSAMAAPLQGTGLRLQVFDDPDFSNPIGPSQIVPLVSVTNSTYIETSIFEKTPNPKLNPRPAATAVVPVGGRPGSSMRWTGRITAPYTDSYRFSVPVPTKGSLHSIRVTVDGQVVLAGGRFGLIGTNNFSAANNGDESYVSEPVAFTAGQGRSIKIEHSTESDSGQFAALKWLSVNKVPSWLILTKSLSPD